MSTATPTELKSAESLFQISAVLDELESDGQKKTRQFDEFRVTVAECERKRD